MTTSDTREVNMIKQLLMGDYIIIPGQNMLLDNTIIKVSNTKLEIFINSLHKQVYDFKVNNIKVSQFNNDYLYNMEIYVDSVNKFNFKTLDEVDNLLTNIYKLIPPTTLHLSYNVNNNIYLLKNNDFKTVAMLEKIK
jgi:hypothetical protein